MGVGLKTVKRNAAKTALNRLANDGVPNAVKSDLRRPNEDGEVLPTDDGWTGFLFENDCALSDKWRKKKLIQEKLHESSWMTRKICLI